MLVREQVHEDHSVTRANIQAMQKPLEQSLMAGHTFPYFAHRNGAIFWYAEVT